MSIRKSDSEAKANAQNTALISIKVIIRFLFPPNVVTSKVPMTGEKKIGVKNETPNSP